MLVVGVVVVVVVVIVVLVVVVVVVVIVVLVVVVVVVVLVVVKRLCHIRGKLRKKVWINQSDIILVGLRDYQDARADVILKYSPEEARNLKSYGEFPETVKINETVTFGEEGFDDDIEFDDVDSSEEENDLGVEGIDNI